MADIEKVIEGVHHCYEVKGCDNCPYEEGCAYSFDNDEKPHCPIMDDILALLKEQDEPVEPLTDELRNRICPKCNTVLKGKYCHECGQPVLWEG